MTTALIIVGLVVLVGAIGFLVWWILRRNKKALEGFVTKHGVNVIPSKKTLYLTAEEVEAWTDDLVAFWHEKMDWSSDDIYRAIDGMRVTMRDVDKLEYRINGKLYYAVGLTQIESRRMVIATLPRAAKVVDKKRIWSLYRHETSHIPVAALGGLWTNEASHALFKEQGLGA